MTDKQDNMRWVFYSVVAIGVTVLLHAVIVRIGAIHWDWKLIKGEMGTWLGSSGITTAVAVWLIRLSRGKDAQIAELTDKLEAALFQTDETDHGATDT